MTPIDRSTGPDRSDPPGFVPRRRPGWPVAAAVLATLAVAAMLVWWLLPAAGIAIPGLASGGFPGSETQGAAAPDPAEDGSAEPAGPEPEEPPAPVCTQVTIKAVGDLLMHLPLVQAAATGDGHDFAPLLAPVADLLADADLTIANLETTFGGPERGWSGYPRFNTPDSLADAVRDAGIDVLTTANNHALDTGGAGLVRTLEVIRAAGLASAGTRAAPDEPGFAMVEAGGLQVAVLAYTYGTNGIPLPEPYMVNLLDREQMAADVAAARAAGADLIIAAPHWGLEYQRQPSDEQRDLAAYLVSLGVDVIFGAHPHVVQPVEVLEPAGPGGRPVPVFYSMGNFASNQRDRYTDWGLIAEVTFLVEHWPDADEPPRIYLSRVAHQPVWVHRYWDAEAGRRGYRVLAATAAQADPLLTSEDLRRLEAVAAEALELPGAAELYALEPGPADAAGSVNRRNASTSATAASMPSCQNAESVRSTFR